jgi:hypothetical protein
LLLGLVLGKTLGLLLGRIEVDIVGLALGDSDGDPLGTSLGEELGASEGEFEGDLLGDKLGASEEDTLGVSLGEVLGFTLGLSQVIVRVRLSKPSSPSMMRIPKGTKSLDRGPFCVACNTITKSRVMWVPIVLVFFTSRDTIPVAVTRPPLVVALFLPPILLSICTACSPPEIRNSALLSKKMVTASGWFSKFSTTVKANLTVDVCLGSLKDRYNHAYGLVEVGYTPICATFDPAMLALTAWR